MAWPVAHRADRGGLRRAAAALLLLALGACDSKDEQPYAPQFAERPDRPVPVYVFGPLPSHNPQALFELYQPLVDYLNAHMDGPRIKLEASRDYASFEHKLADRHFAFALANPLQAVESLSHGYRVFGKTADDQDFLGLILVRKDGGIRSVQDLRGKAISYPAASAVAAAVMPQLFLQRHGLDVARDTESRFVGSHESVIMNVYLGNTAAGTTWPPPWRAFAKAHPDMAAQLEVKWKTPTLLNNALIVRDDLPPAVAGRIGALLIGMRGDAAGQAVLSRLEVSGFEAAGDGTYAGVREFLLRAGTRLRDQAEAR